MPRAAHTCAVSEGAGRRGALTALAPRNLSPDGPRAFPSLACGFCFPGVLGDLGSGREKFSWVLAALLRVPVRRCPVDPLSLVFLLLVPWSLGSGAAGKAMRPAVTFAFSFCIREAGRWGESVLRSP